MKFTDNNDKLKISVKSNEPTKKKCSVDFEIEIYNELNNLSKKTNRSKNELINMLLKFALGKVEFSENK